MSYANRQPRMSPGERAQRYVDKMPPTLCGTGTCRKVTHRVACVLAQGFALSVSEALPILCGWAASGTHKFSESELRAELESASHHEGFRDRGGLLPRGCLLKESGFTPSAAERQARNIPTETEHRKAITFDAAKLRGLAGDWSGQVNLPWLANRSSIDPALVTTEDFLHALYQPEKGDRVLVMDKYDDGHLWPDEPLPHYGRDGVKFLSNPVDGQWRPNVRAPREKWQDEKPPMSRRIWECVREFRFLVLESDVAKPEDWLGFIVQAPLRIAAIYSSGGKSIHALVQVDCPTRQAFEAEKAALAPFLSVCLMAGADKGPLSLLGPTRLPQCFRGGKVKPPEKPGERWGFFPFKDGPHLQKLLYLRPNPPVRPLLELPVVRDVEKHWLAQAVRVQDGYDELTPDLYEALGYYAPCNRDLRAILRELPKPERKEEMNR